VRRGGGRKLSLRPPKSRQFLPFSLKGKGWSRGGKDEPRLAHPTVCLAHRKNRRNFAKFEGTENRIIRGGVTELSFAKIEGHRKG